MADLKPGKKSTEWWTVVGVIALAAAKALGIIPEDATEVTVMDGAQGAVPYLIDRLMSLAGNNSSILIAAGIAWAYLKRRYGLKAREIAKEIPNGPKPIS